MIRDRVSELLRNARERIEDPERWTTGVEAVDEYNEEVPRTSDRAVAWCALGTMEASIHLFSLGDRREYVPTKAYAALRDAIRLRYDFDGHALFFLTEINDEYEDGHRRVLELYDEAIRIAERRFTGRLS